MNKLTLTLAVAGYVLGATAPLTGAANAASQSVFPPATIVAAQEDCKEGETWNDETQKCEVKDG